MALPVGPLPANAADAGFSAGPTVAGASTTTRSPLQDSALAEATDEASAGPRAVPTMRPMMPAKARRRRRSGILCCFRQAKVVVGTVDPHGDVEEYSSNCCCLGIHWNFEAVQPTCEGTSKHDSKHSISKSRTAISSRVRWSTGLIDIN